MPYFANRDRSIMTLLVLALVHPLSIARSAERRALLPKPQVIVTQDHTMANAQSVAFSPDGKLAAAGYGGPSSGRFPLKSISGGTAVWNVATGERVQFVGEYGDIVSLDFTADSKSLLYGRLYTPGDSVDYDIMCLIDIAKGETSRPWGRFGRWHVCAASPTADVLLMENGKAIAHITSKVDLAAGKTEGHKLEFEGSYSPRCASFATDGSCFAVVHSRLESVIAADGQVRRNVKKIRCKCLTLFDAKTFELRCRIVSDKLLDCNAVTVAAGGEWIATGHQAGVVRVWNSEQQKQARLLKTPATGYARPLFSPAGERLAVLAQSSSSRTWHYANTPTGFEFGEAKNGSQSEVVFFDTKTFTPAVHWQFPDGTFRTWHANRPRASLNPERIAFSPNGKQLLIGAGGVTLVEIATNKVVRQFDVQ